MSRDDLIEIKVRCDAHPSKSTTVVERVTVVRRLPDCDAVRRSLTPPDAQEPSGTKCADFLILDRQRSSEMCASCAGSAWRVARIGMEMLRGTDYVGDASVVMGAGRLGKPNEELHREVRYRFRFVCPRCGPRGPDVQLTHEAADVVFSRLAEEGKQRVMLSRLATMTS